MDFQSAFPRNSGSGLCIIVLPTLCVKVLLYRDIVLPTLCVEVLLYRDSMILTLSGPVYYLPSVIGGSGVEHHGTLNRVTMAQKPVYFPRIIMNNC